MERPRPLRLRKLARFPVAELAGVRLAAGDAAVEEDVVIVLGEQRFGLDGDGHRRRAAVERRRRAAQRVEEELIPGVGIGREVVPHQALDRVVPRRHARLRVRGGDDRLENLEAAHFAPRAAVFRPLHGKSEQPLLRRVGSLDRERNRVGSSHREHLEPPDRCRLEAHGDSPESTQVRTDAQVNDEEGENARFTASGCGSGAERHSAQ